MAETIAGQYLRQVRPRKRPNQPPRRYSHVVVRLVLCSVLEVDIRGGGVPDNIVSTLITISIRATIHLKTWPGSLTPSCRRSSSSPASVL